MHRTCHTPYSMAEDTLTSPDNAFFAQYVCLSCWGLIAVCCCRVFSIGQLVDLLRNPLILRYSVHHYSSQERTLLEGVSNLLYCNDKRFYSLVFETC